VIEIIDHCRNGREQHGRQRSCDQQRKTAINRKWFEPEQVEDLVNCRLEKAILSNLWWCSDKAPIDIGHITQ
jgi:hypothetical protein